MKKITAILLIILVLFSAASCSSTIAEPSITASVLPTAVPTPIDTPSPTPSPTVTPSPTPIQYIYKDAVVLDLADVMEQASTAHRTRLETEINYDQLLEYIPNDPEAKALLTREEIKLLKEEREMKETLIPYDEAVADVELYFRTLKYAYALYYYFGGDEAFNAAQQEIMAYLEGKDGIYAEDLAQCIYDSLDFIRDVHNQISGRHYGENRQQRYEYHYSAEPHDFSADEHGFYKETVTGDKWYFDSFTASDARLEISLNDDGWLVYSPVLFCPAPQVPAQDSIVLTCNGQTREEPITWVESESLAREAFHDESEYHFITDESVYYQSMRSFEPSLEEDFKKFAADAKKARSADALIVDIRCNGGGTSEPSGRWMKGFCRRDAVLNSANAGKATPLENGISSSTYGKEHFDYDIHSTGKFIENEVPLFVLIDDKCGSAGEIMLLNLHTLNNSLIIGSNSAGYQIGGNNIELRLPNSGIAISFATGIRFKYGMNNVDAIGYEPDVWCNPKHAATALSFMLSNYGMITEESAAFLDEQLYGVAHSNVQLELMIEGDIVPSGSGFGRDKTSYVTVLNSGEPITDFTLDENSDPAVCTVEVTPDGKLKITPGEPGNSWITITHRGKSFSFRWRT